MQVIKSIAEISDFLIKKASKIVPKISPVSPPKRIVQAKGDEEIFVILLSDFQVGIKTATYNVKTFEKRMKNLTVNLLKVVDLHRKSHQVNNLVVFLLGDIVHNENIMRFLSLDELDVVIHEQVFQYAVPQLQAFFIEMLKHFRNILVYCVRGNHGQFGKLYSSTTNLDDVVYHFLKSSFSENKRITFKIAETFYNVADVYGKRFLLVHGDTINMHYQMPWYGITTRAMRWTGSIGDFDYLCMGHFHSFAVIDWLGKTIFVNGTFLSDDDWSKQRLGLKSSVCQMLLGVHPKRGVSFVRKIFLE